MAEILLVFPPQQQATDVEDLKAMLDASGDHRIQQASNLEAGMRALRHGCDLAIVGSRLAASRDDSVVEDGGVAFCESARGESQAPLLLLAPVVTDDLRRRCRRIAGRVEPLDRKEQVRDAALDLLSLAPAARLPDEPLQLQITVSAGDTAWSYTMVGVGFEFESNGDLVVGRATWMLWADLHYQADHWYSDFTKIGRSIKTCLCDENEGFRKDLETAQAKADLHVLERGGQGPAQVQRRVSFVVSPSLYPLLLEAIYHPSHAEPWLAEARLSRCISGTRSERGDLFQGSPGSRRALVICANTSGAYRNPSLPGGGLLLDALGTVDEECKRVAALLQRVDRRTGQPLFGAGNVTCIGRDRPVSRRELLDTLAAGPWDLIHFAGHSHCRRPDSGKDPGHGYLFVGGTGTPEAVDFIELVTFMKKARFVYFSSCESGDSSFAVEAAATGINTVVGYRWRIFDRTAELHALLFYRHLLRHRSIDTAFGNVRRSFYRQHRERDSTWASAMLVTPER